MKKNILKSFFSSGLQAIAVQVFGLMFMLLSSFVLSKEDFGVINWANATAMLITALLSFGMEQVVMRRIAVSDKSDWAAAAFLVHNFIGSVLSLLLICLMGALGNSSAALQYLPMFFAAQAIVFLVTPLKQFLNAKQIFAPYGVIAIISNLVKVGIGVYLAKFGGMTINSVGLILIGCSAFEFVAIYIYASTKANFRLKFKAVAYKKLLKESAPQFMATIFDSSLSRLDWILLGLISTYAATGEYGFAYRAYELARLPIVIIAPIILNIFARVLISGNKLADDKQQQVNELLGFEMFVAMLIPLVGNLLWSPVVGMIFKGKYGASNEIEFLLLSLCVPLHFFINLMWTLTFSAKKYKKITTITILTAIVNLLLNLLLIPQYGGIGAAIAYLITTMFQALAYYSVVNKHLVNLSLWPLIKLIIIAAVVYSVALSIDIHIVLRLLISVSAYLLLCFITGSVKILQLHNLKSYLKR